MNEYCKILVVDDEFIMRQGIKHMIDWEQEGFQVIGHASNGNEAIDMIKSETPHIVISDIVMPQMDGVELTKFIQSNYPHIQIIILSSYSDFEYVKSSFQYGAVDYILKPALNPIELLKTLKKISKKIPNLTLSANGKTNTENILNRLILGFATNVDFNYLNNLFILPHFCLFGINTKLIYDDYKQHDKILDFLTTQLDIEFSSEDVIEITNIENEIIVLVINFKTRDYKTILNKLIKITDMISNNFSKTFFVLSKIFDSVNDIKYIYENNFLPLTQQYFYNKDFTFLYSEYSNSAKCIDKFNFKSFSELVMLLQLSNAFEMLTEYIVTAISNRCLTQFELKTLIQNSLYNIITALESLNFDTLISTQLKRTCFDKIDSSKYAEDLMLTYESILKDFNEIIDKHQNTINNHMINKIVKYIRIHYSEQLTLSDVSQLFNFNYSYLSYYFSSHNKEGFNEFLNKIRIEKACEFLKRDIPISDISSMVGYSDHSYFCKVFKKFTSFTPSNFRKSSIKILE